MLERAAGILLHPTSLPGSFGIGDLGINAKRFVELLKNSGQKIWQVFPLGPTGYGDSPYQSFSAFAGNPLLISPEILKDQNLLSEHDLNHIPEFNKFKIEYGEVINFKFQLFNKAFSKFSEYKVSDNPNYLKFVDENAFWLEDFSLFMALKEENNGKPWSEWETPLVLREQDAINKAKSKLNDRINFQKFLQYCFFEQWNDVKNYAYVNNIKIIGDMPIYIAYDSSDTWSNKRLFSVSEDGKLELCAGVPPDYFSETGQLWGNPLYNWKQMKEENFDWWKKRFAQLLKIVDVIRIDHFRGLDAYWEIPGNAQNAIKGRWVKAPGVELFNEVQKEMGQLPIIAEDLGVITDSVVDLRDRFNFPGIKILQFGFGANGDKKFLPHRYPQNCVVHTGSHDNDTTKGFLEIEKNKKSGIFEWAQNYLNNYSDNLTFSCIKALYSSVANTVVIPMQDLLNLGSEARMNIPGTTGGNWQWRFDWEQIDGDFAQTFYQLSDLYERINLKVESYEIINVQEN